MTVTESKEHKKTIEKNNYSWGWGLLRGFGASNIATATVLMPFVGYLVLYNAELSEMFGELGGALDLQPAAANCAPVFSIHSRVNLLYLGLFFVGLSALLFKAFAPKELKLYNGVDEYIDAERQNLTARKVRSMYRTIKGRRTRLGRELLAKAKWLGADVSIQKASTEFAANKNEDVILDLMRCYHQVQDRNHRRAIVVTCLLLFLAGSLLLAIPSVAFTFRVLCTIGYSICG